MGKYRTFTDEFSCYSKPLILIKSIKRCPSFKYEKMCSNILHSR